MQNPTQCLHIQITSKVLFFLLLVDHPRRDRRVTKGRRRRDATRGTFRRSSRASDDAQRDDDERGDDGAMRDDARDGKSDTKDC